jgi:hypothetical protein
MSHRIRIEDPTEALVVEQALAMVRELKQTCTSAPDGHVLAAAEIVAVATGRELTRRCLEAVLNAQAEGVQKKGRRRGRVLAVVPASTAEASRDR